MEIGRKVFVMRLYFLNTSFSRFDTYTFILVATGIRSTLGGFVKKAGKLIHQYYDLEVSLFVTSMFSWGRQCGEFLKLAE